MKLQIIVILIFLHVSCSDMDKHKLIFTVDKTISEVLIPPSGCYKVKLIANGKLNCDSKLELFMNNKKTNFLNNLVLNGEYVEKEIYNNDWYEDSFQLLFVPDSCLVDTFKVDVEFFD